MTIADLLEIVEAARCLLLSARGRGSEITLQITHEGHTLSAFEDGDTPGLWFVGIMAPSDIDLDGIEHQRSLWFGHSTENLSYACLDLIADLSKQNPAQEAFGEAAP